MLKTIIALLVAHSAPGAINAKYLAPAILKEAKYFNEDPILIAQIIIIESKGRSDAFNAKTLDYGIMQINLKTAAAMHLDTACLLDWRCNLRAGVQILSKMDMACRYNVGTGYLKGKKLENCLKYADKLATIK